MSTGANDLCERKSREEVRVEDLVTVPGGSQSWMVREREAYRGGPRLLGRWEEPVRLGALSP